jgi:hypothetical protein
MREHVVVGADGSRTASETPAADSAGMQASADMRSYSRAGGLSRPHDMAQQIVAGRSDEGAHHLHWGVMMVSVPDLLAD